jgi:hypothetical protein
MQSIAGCYQGFARRAEKLTRQRLAAQRESELMDELV